MTVYLRSPGGTIFQVSEAQTPELLSEGYTPLSGEETMAYTGVSLFPPAATYAVPAGVVGVTLGGDPVGPLVTVGTLLAFILKHWSIATALKIVAAIVSLGMAAELSNPHKEGTALPDWLERIIYTVLPGQQAFLGEFPPGLDKLGGQVVKKWRAGVAYFAIILRTTKTGFVYQRVVYSAKRSLWVPVSIPRNIVVGAKELRIAAALGHKRRVGKRRLLQLIARPYPRRQQFRRRH